MRFYGLVYVKHGQVGTKSEGPDYWLQTSGSDYRLRLHDRPMWEPDFELEFYNRRIVEVVGEQEDECHYKWINVEQLWVIAESTIPSQESQPELGDAFRLGLGHRVALADARVELALTSVNDSRCPTGAQCIRAGEAVLHLEVIADGAGAQTIEVTLEDGRPELAVATVGAYKIEATRLDPYPTLHEANSGEGPTMPVEIFATLIVTRS